MGNKNEQEQEPIGGFIQPQGQQPGYWNPNPQPPVNSQGNSPGKGFNTAMGILDFMSSMGSGGQGQTVGGGMGGTMKPNVQQPPEGGGLGDLIGIMKMFF